MLRSAPKTSRSVPVARAGRGVTGRRHSAACGQGSDRAAAAHGHHPQRAQYDVSPARPWRRHARFCPAPPGSRGRVAALPVRKAVLVCGGLSPMLYPATKVGPATLLPVPGPDGSLWPAAAALGTRAGSLSFLRSAAVTARARRSARGCAGRHRGGHCHREPFRRRYACLAVSAVLLANARNGQRPFAPSSALPPRSGAARMRAQSLTWVRQAELRTHTTASTRRHAAQFDQLVARVTVLAHAGGEGLGRAVRSASLCTASHAAFSHPRPRPRSFCSAPRAWARSPCC